MNLYFNKEKILEIILKLKSSSLNFKYDYQKHRIVLMDYNFNEQAFLRLPVHLAYPCSRDRPETVNYVIALIQSGSCAVGLYSDEVNLDHKVFSAYMVRKKQGVSQVKYLKTKGKSKAGSRVRLAGAALFFANINERLQMYFDNYKIDRIALSCSKILIPHLHNAKVHCPFDKKDERLLKIPRHIHLPNYEVLNDIHKFLSKGELSCDDSQRAFMDQIYPGSIFN